VKIERTQTILGPMKAIDGGVPKEKEN
jgi:hypothetical protein